jgi:hypothetical protein
MKNGIGATVYYLFFASHKPVAQKIVSFIFDKYKCAAAEGARWPAAPK